MNEKCSSDAAYLDLGRSGLLPYSALSCEDELLRVFQAGSEINIFGW